MGSKAFFEDLQIWMLKIVVEKSIEIKLPKSLHESEP